MSGMGTAPASHHDLIEMTAEALHKRAAYIVEHLDSLQVRVKDRTGHKYQSVYIRQLGIRSAIREAFRLLLGSEVRAPGERAARSGDADPAAGEG
jgi:hypothetical protein